jgi:hypothetical protein
MDENQRRIAIDIACSMVEDENRIDIMANICGDEDFTYITLTKTREGVEMRFAPDIILATPDEMRKFAALVALATDFSAKIKDGWIDTTGMTPG